MTTDFKIMESTVDDICRSITDDPGRWLEGVHTLTDRHSGIEYWMDRDAITDVWSGHSRKTVFSHAQGERILDALNMHRGLRASQAQQRVINAMKPRPHTPTAPSIWARLWKLWG